MKQKRYKLYAADFETTVYDSQTYTEVWASACVELFTDDVKIFHSIDEQFRYYINIEDNVRAYYHNLKFDGAFWIDYAIRELKLEQALDTDNTWLADSKMKNNTFKYSISDKGQWYYITFKINNKILEIRDSLKLLPFSLKRIGESFGTEHKKLEMEYKGIRYAGIPISEEEQKYIENDVLVLKEALEIMFKEGHDKLTIGSCCFSEFKDGYHKSVYNELFPNLHDIELSENIYGSKNAGEYINRSYFGGWCYLVKGKEKRVYHNGITVDVNSLYPSQMSSESGNTYPVGKPTFWRGNFIPELDSDSYYFVRFKCRFRIKDNKLPFIHIRNNLLYNSNECLESTDIYDKVNKRYVRYYKIGNDEYDTITEMTLTMTDYVLFREHYNTSDFEILDGCYFRTEVGIFDKYIEKYKSIKMTSKGAKRELAKLYLNNLYGKMATSTNSSFKIAYLTEAGDIKFRTIPEYKKKPGYIAIGSAITSYARNFTIRAAQLNYRGFIYADTDSMHLDIDESELTGVKIHDTDFNCWSVESKWEVGYFARQKTYIEVIGGEMDIKCAGMSDKSKKLFAKSVLQNFTTEELEKYTDEEKEFILTPRNITDFRIGLSVPGKLMPTRIPGGILLKETTYKMR